MLKVTKVTYQSMKALQLVEAEELHEEKEIILAAQILSFSTGTEITAIDFAKHLNNNRRYLPSILSRNEALGLEINGKFVALNCHVDFDQIKLPDGSTDPYRYDVSLYGDGEDCLTLSVRVKESVTYRAIKAACKDLSNPENMAVLVAAVENPGSANLEDGTYEIDKFLPGVKCHQVQLKTGQKVNVSILFDIDTTELTARNGFIYSSVNGSLLAGVTMTGGAKKLIDGTHYEVGDIYEVEGITALQGEHKAYYIAKMTNLRTKESDNYYVEEMLLRPTLRKANKGEKCFFRVDRVRPMTGKMTSTKPEFVSATAEDLAAI